MNKSIIYFFLICVFCSCRGNNANTKTQARKLPDMEIVIPDYGMAIMNGRDTVLSISDNMVRIVSFYDSTICSSCEISDIWLWEVVVDSYNEEHLKVMPILIFSPSEEKVDEVRWFLKAHPEPWPVYLDTLQLFTKANPELNTKRHLHTFLIDNHNKVVLSGNPIKNYALIELYQNKIDSLLIFNRTEPILMQ